MSRRYEPWKSLGITETEYWKRRYLESQQSCQCLADALEFIRDCEDDEELGIPITASFLKEQASWALQTIII